jgi:hypothetical protein
VFQAFVVSERADATVIRESNGVQRELKNDDIASRMMQKLSAMPDGLVANLTPQQLADLLAYLESRKVGRGRMSHSPGEWDMRHPEEDLNTVQSL